MVAENIIEHFQPFFFCKNFGEKRFHNRPPIYLQKIDVPFLVQKTKIILPVFGKVIN